MYNKYGYNFGISSPFETLFNNRTTYMHTNFLARQLI